MGKKKEVPEEDLIIPKQDNRICGVICICQMTLVLSTVAIVYLTVASYMPSIREFNSGIDETPVMCTTTKTVRKENCEWVSCAEWCLSKPSGACIQIFVNLRNNGSSLLFQNCTNSANKTCYGIDQETATKLRCIKEECRNLTGIFNCTGGNCTDVTSAFECTFHHKDPPLKCSGRRGKVECMDMEGLFTCHRGSCEKVRSPYNCERRCVDIPTRNKNVILMNGDNVFLSKCSSVYDLKSNTEVWNESDDRVLMLSCYTTFLRDDGIGAIDCLNASLLEKNMLDDMANFTYLSYIHYAVATADKKITPLEGDLTISNSSGIKINMEGCVNTLKGECDIFHKFYGKDGSDHNARARYPCYYSENSVDMVVARYNLKETENLFMFTLLLPSILLVVSCFTLCICQKTVVVGDDAKMRFKCSDDTQNILDSEGQAKDGVGGDAS